MKKTIILSAALMGCLFFSQPADARITRHSTYRYDQIWSTAIRFLRVDHGYKVTEYDRETGYVLFEYEDAGKRLVASLELFRSVRDGYRYVTVGLRIQDMPSYVETMVLDRLERKLRDEYGRPPEPAMELPEPKKKASKADKPSEDESEADNSEESDKSSSKKGKEVSDK